MLREAGKGRTRSTNEAGGRDASTNPDRAAFLRYAIGVGVAEARKLLDRLAGLVGGV